MTHHYIEVNNTRLHYIQKKGQSDLTIIFLHGRALSSEMWTRQFNSETLSAHNLIAVDLPGHGESEHAPDFLAAYSIEGLKDILIKFINDTGINNFILAGLSLGGHIALQSLPELKNCLGVFVMTMPITRPAQPTFMYQNMELLGKVFKENAAPEDVTDYASVLLGLESVELPAFIENAYYKADPKIHEGILNSLIQGAHLDEVDLITNLGIPIAVVAGSQEQIHDLAYLDHFNLPLWRNSYHLVEKAGHLLPWENPQDVNKLLAAFSSDCFSLVR